MKFTTMMFVAILAFLSSVSMAYASDTYYPPERINCTINEKNTLSCDEFNRRYLVEDGTSADVQKDKDDIFHFVSAVAYFTPDHGGTVMFFTYNNNQHQEVKLRTIDGSIRPDLFNGVWKQMTDDIYTCSAAYMECSITNLPNYS